MPNSRSGNCGPGQSPIRVVVLHDVSPVLDEVSLVLDDDSLVLDEVPLVLDDGPNCQQRAAPLKRRRMAAKLGDVVAKDLRILLVAINPAPLSAALGQHFATPTNKFLELLFASGLTSRRFPPSDAPRLVDEGIGLTSLAMRPTRAAAELTRAEQREGAAALVRRVARLRPQAVALLGLTLFPIVFPDAVEPGPGLKKVTLAGARVFVVPNPSGRNRAYPGFEKKLVWYRALAEAFPRPGRVR
jgi:TDG/mug DNA glycosylase family protein